MGMEEEHFAFVQRNEYGLNDRRIGVVLRSKHGHGRSVNLGLRIYPGRYGCGN
jgi:hypothetical protein